MRKLNCFDATNPGFPEIKIFVDRGEQQTLVCVKKNVCGCSDFEVYLRILYYTLHTEGYTAWTFGTFPKKEIYNFLVMMDARMAL